MHGHKLARNARILLFMSTFQALNANQLLSKLVLENLSFIDRPQTANLFPHCECAIILNAFYRKVYTKMTIIP